VRVRLVLPGRAPETRFGENAPSRMQSGFPEVYADLAKSVFARWGQESAITRSVDVAKAVWRAANDPSCPVRVEKETERINPLAEASGESPQH